MPRRAYGSRSHRRIYKKRRWKLFRKQILDEQPLCVRCHPPGQPIEPPFVLATDVHHLVRTRDDESAAFDPDKVEPLCAGCHASGRQKEERFVEDFGYSPAVDEDGFPIDPNHPFNAKRGGG